MSELSNFGKSEFVFLLNSKQRSNFCRATIMKRIISSCNYEDAPDDLADFNKRHNLKYKEVVAYFDEWGNPGFEVGG